MEKNEIKRYITESLFILMKTMPYEKITIDLISKKAGVSRRTIYRYFNNKQEILDKCFKELIFKYNQKAQTDVIEGKDAILSSFEFIYDNADLFILAYRNNLLENLTTPIQEVVKKIVFSRKADETTWTQEYADYYISFIAGGIYRLIYQWFKNNGDKSPQEIYNIYKSVINDLNLRMSN